MRVGIQLKSSMQLKRKQSRRPAVEMMTQDQPLKCMKMLMRKIHGGFNQAGSEASSDEEEEGSEDGKMMMKTNSQHQPQ